MKAGRGSFHNLQIYVPQRVQNRWKSIRGPEKWHLATQTENDRFHSFLRIHSRHVEGRQKPNIQIHDRLYMLQIRQNMRRRNGHCGSFHRQ